jgi:hypothetical protein
MAAMGVNYNPASVMMGSPARAGSPYLPTSPIKPAPERPNAPASTSAPTSTLAAVGNRATGPSSGYDPAYLQNLVTYGAGQFQQPSGGFNFNPTNINTFPGAPTGGGNAPVLGMPNTLLSQAQGGQAFSWMPPEPVQQFSALPGQSTVNTSLQDWIKQFMMGGTPGMATK